MGAQYRARRLGLHKAVLFVVSRTLQACAFKHIVVSSPGIGFAVVERNMIALRGKTLRNT